jgi:hypothetical protein
LNNPVLGTSLADIILVILVTHQTNELVITFGL